MKENQSRKCVFLSEIPLGIKASGAGAETPKPLSLTPIEKQKGEVQDGVCCSRLTEHAHRAAPDGETGRNLDGTIACGDACPARVHLAGVVK